MQILLFSLLKHSGPGALSNIFIALTAILALLPVATAPRWLEMRVLVLMRALSVFPTFVLVAPILQLFGFTMWWNWLLTLVGR